MVKSSTVKINLKWNGKTFKNFEINLSENGKQFKERINKLTGVPQSRQKFVGIKGGKLQDDTILSSLKFKNGQKISLIGTAEETNSTIEKTVFIEDISEDSELQGNLMESLPPGLNNLGNTCYMNACLQCIKEIPELKSVLQNYDGFSTNGQDVRHDMTVRLRDLFSSLDKGKLTVNPMLFVVAFRKAFPSFAQTVQTEMGPVYAQQDADEFLSNLLQSIEQKLKNDNFSPINSLFRGTYEVTVKCLENKDEKPNVLSENFFKLSCHISKETLSLNYGLKNSLISTLEKNSPTLNKNALYQKEVKVTRLPPYLCINFVRFCWRSDKQSKAKILKDVKFPIILDVYDLCADSLKKDLKENREILKKKRDEELDVLHLSEEEKKKREKKDFKIKQLSGNSTGLYELCGVVTHVGRSADSGHYIGWSKEGDGRWLKYDDEKVTEVDEQAILKLSGGGDWHTAYVLIYRSKKSNGNVIDQS